MLCDFRGLDLRINKCLAAHRQKALCCYLFALGLALVYVAVNLDSIIRFIVCAPIGSSPPLAGPDNVSCDGYAKIALMVKRQSVSHDVLLDFGSEMLHPLGCVVVSSLMLINGRGCVPWRSRETGGSVKWTTWLCIVLVICAAMWLVYNIPVRCILCGKSYPSDVQVLNLISSDFQKSFDCLRFTLWAGFVWNGSVSFVYPIVAHSMGQQVCGRANLIANGANSPNRAIIASVAYVLCVWWPCWQF